MEYARGNLGANVFLIEKFSSLISGPWRKNSTVYEGGEAHGDKRPPLMLFEDKNVWNIHL